MEELNVLPIYRNGLGEISNGIDICVPEFCRKNCEKNNRCMKHYQEMCVANPGYYRCPYGFGSYVFKVDNDNCIFTCLRVENHYDKSKLMPKLKGEGKNHKEISFVNLEKYAVIYTEYQKNQQKFERHQSFVNDVLHDVRKYNQQIKLKNDRLFRMSQEKDGYRKFLEVSKGLHVLSWFLTLRLNNYDFTYSENLMQSDVKSSYNMYRIIDKVRQCMKEKSEAKDIRIKLDARRECQDIQAYDCIELLPFLLMDNAIKYSPKGENVDIVFEERGNEQHIKFRSLGPTLSETELEKICNQGYRGENAKELTDDGMGIGLYTASCICKLNDIRMEVHSESEIKKRTLNINFSNFVVDLWAQMV